MTFQDLNLIEPIQRALKTAGYKNPTPIQAQSIPTALQGRDLLACAQTGTGKTAAFAIPILQLMQSQGRNEGRNRPARALILAPTRELAIQIGESFDAYGKFLELRHTVIFGGVSQHAQTRNLQSGIDIIIATPGRLLDLMNQGFIKLDKIEFFVLDEADRMLDMGFIHDVKRVIRQLPARRQTLFFSATMPPVVAELANGILTRPEKVAVDPVSSTAERVEQAVFFVSKNQKRDLLIHLLKTEDIPTALVFTRTKHGANRVVKELDKKGIKAEAIHGNKSQNARQQALSNFKARRTRVLVATDIAARGIDVEDLTHVINYDLPNISETYVHRIGRTGRAGASGIALSFCDEEEQAYLRDIQKLIGQRIHVVKNHPFPMEEGQAATQPAITRPAANGYRNGRDNNGSQRNNWSNSQSNNRRRPKRSSTGAPVTSDRVDTRR
ncbi:MAG: DEAD/DEAH box helicase [Phaeodactylibacter sp.]|nr:DEAD/DEAH box helicase [Phaeodactylibacter sp.]MCB9302747.1 DEAD/DEAH box helicase [Lewinellaceae bacterium]